MSRKQINKHKRKPKLYALGGSIYGAGIDPYSIGIAPGAANNPFTGKIDMLSPINPNQGNPFAVSPMSLSQYNSQAGQVASKGAGLTGIMGAAGGVLSGVSGIMQGAMSNSQIADTSGIESTIDEQANRTVGAVTNDSLMEEWSNFTKLKDNYNRKSVRGVSGGQMASNTLGSLGSGIASGAMVGGPIGGIIGGVAGLGSAIGGIFGGNRRARRKARRLNKQAREANERSLSSLEMRAGNIDTQNDLNILANFSALGGPINTFAHGGDFDNGVITIDEGGTHEENPNQGVQVGIDQQGIPNLVEEGEVIYNDYVFSDRIEIPEEMKKRYKIKGKTFASAAKSAQKESLERPFDPISKRGLDASMANIQMAQEELKQIEEQDTNSNMFAEGGDLKREKYLNYLEKDKQASGKNYLGRSSGSGNVPDIFWKLRGINPVDFEGKYGGGKGGGAGTTSKFTTPYKNGRKELYINPAVAVEDNFHDAFGRARKQGASKFTFGGKDYTTEMNNNPNNNRVAKERKISEIIPTDEYLLSDIQSQAINQRDTLSRPVSPSEYFTLKEKDKVNRQRLTGNTFAKGGKRQTYTKYAPIVGAGIGTLTSAFEKPDFTDINAAEREPFIPSTVGFKPIGNMLAYNPLDRDFYINKLNKNSAATRSNILSTSGGNRATAQAGLLAADRSYGENLGQLARQAEEYNDNKRERVEGFNRQTNMTNADLGFRADAFNAQSINEAQRLNIQRRQQSLALRQAQKDAVIQRRSANISNLLQGLGDLGWENENYNWADRLAKDGVLKIDTNGNITIAPEVKAKDGKLNKRKGFTYG